MKPANRFLRHVPSAVICSLAACIMLGACRNRISCSRCEVTVTLAVRLTANDSLISEERILLKQRYALQSVQDSIEQLIAARSGPDRTVSRNDSSYNCENEQGLDATTASQLEAAGWTCQLPK